MSSQTFSDQKFSHRNKQRRREEEEEKRKRERKRERKKQRRKKKRRTVFQNFQRIVLQQGISSPALTPSRLQQR